MCDNFDCALELMMCASDNIRGTESITFDSGIYQHYYELPEELEELKEEDDIHILEASKDKPITLQTFINVIYEINEQFTTMKDLRCDGRSYYYEGIRFYTEDNMYHIRWGS